MAGNWGAILAGLAGGAGSLGQSMSENADKAELRKRQAIADAIAMLATKDKYGLSPIAEGVSDKDALNQGAIGQLNQTKLGLQMAGGGSSMMPRIAEEPSYTEQREEQTEYGPQSVETIGANRFLRDPSQGVEARTERRTNRTDTRKAEEAFKRLLQTQEGQRKIAEFQAQAAASRAAEAFAGRKELATQSQSAAMDRTKAMMGGISGTFQSPDEGGTPNVMAYNRFGQTRSLGQAVPSGSAAPKADLALAAGEARRSYQNLLDPQTKKIADPPSWFDRTASKSDLTNALASDAGSAYMNNVRGLVRSWIVTVEGKRMSDADARVNEVLKSFRFGAGEIADQQTKERLEGMYKDIVARSGVGDENVREQNRNFLRGKP